MGESKSYLVGIGASAGGLEAITQLIGPLKADLPCAFVVLQHLSPGYRSMMVDILARETRLQVKEVEQGEVPTPGTLYVVPPNANALYKEGRLALVTASPAVVPKPSINEFLISLAAEAGENAIGIVLSGTGSDGVAGLRAIQAAGGYTFAQRPESAKYDGMPRSAIEAGVVDEVVEPAAFPTQLMKLLQLPPAGAVVSPPADHLEKLLDQVRDRLQFDFSGYKLGTLLRRIRRRELATGHADLESYLAWIQDNPQELDLLARDILISVTAFFRDREAFEILKRAIGEICRRKTAGEEVRVWVAGCASGEEAYSIAMLFAEALADRLPLFRVQIFATDIDEEALNVARRGVYPAAAMAEVPAEFLERFFHPVNNAFEVGKVLRDMIVFARHNLVSDPPFLRLDLVSCRNLLIYFDAPLQSKVLRVFHFGLDQDGYLFLGRSESVAQAEQLFVALNRRERLFHKKGEDNSLAGLVPTSISKTAIHHKDHKLDLLLAALAQHFALTAILCDNDGNILHTIGRVEQFLQFPVGVTRLSVAESVSPGLRGELLRLMQQCRQSGKSQTGRHRQRQKACFRLAVEPVRAGGGQLQLVLIVPEKAVKLNDEPAGRGLANRELEDELVSTREHLQVLVEEMATANEEMQGLNEEAQAANEELQATNEELEAANEELQASNEELVSVNEELNVKTHELTRLSEEYAHLYDALQFPIMVFDRNCQLVRFNAPAARRFDLRPTAQRQHISRLRLPDELLNLEILLGSALAHADRIEQIVNGDQRIQRLMITPGLDRVGEIATLVMTLIDVTDIARAQEALSKSEGRLNSLMENTTVIFAMKDVRGDYIYANRRFIDYFGLQEAQYVGHNDFSLFENPLASDLWAGDLQALREHKPVTLQHEIDRSGQKHYLRTVHQVLLDDKNKPTAFITEAEDITKNIQAEEQLRITARIFDQVGEAIAITDSESRILNVNSAFTHITGYLAEECLGEKIGELLKSGRHNSLFYESMWQALNHHGFWQGELWNRRKNGEVYPEWLTINRINNQDGAVEHYVAVFSDISQIRDADRKADFLATHDPLTNLPNRTLFQDRLRHAISQARRTKTRIALLFIDLDNFKTINDTMGHDIGDELIKQAAFRLNESVREMDTIARLGGDEFTAILKDCTLETANQVGQRIVNDLSASYVIYGHSVFVSASVGIAFYPDDGQDSISLIKAADAAMYSAKELGRNRIEFFRPELHTRIMRRKTIENSLRNALQNKLLRLVYQPKFVVENHRPMLIGAEALLRWNDPDLGEIPPAEFIPVAEDGSLIFDLNHFVVNQVLQQINVWHQLQLECPTIAFNLSPRCIHHADCSPNILAAIAQTAIPAQSLQIEITESALLENAGTVITNLNAFRQAGMQIAIDDFGTGYSSLSYLRRLPLSYLKIDKSFVNGLGQSAEDEAIALAVINLAKALGLKTIAEGVERQQQLDWLQDNGCDIFQGYLLGKPMETHAFEDLLVHYHAN